MNRDQKKQIAKAVRKKHGKAISRKQAAQLVNAVDLIVKASDVQEGDKVKLDYDKISSSKRWEQHSSPYREFVEANKDKVFTVEPNDRDANWGSIFQFVEDTTNPKWLFWGGHLKKVEE